jgi:transcriptional regulator with XRE-family HTH domain
MSILRQKLSALLAGPTWTQAKLAEALGVSQSTVNRWTKGTEPEGDHRDALAQLYDEFYGLGSDKDMVRIRGIVSKDQRIKLLDVPDQSWTARPPTLTRNLKALVVKDRGMDPIFNNHSVLFYGEQEDPGRQLGGLVVAELMDGRQFVRRIEVSPYPRKWTLSHPGQPDLEHVEIDRAFPIEWVRMYDPPAPF